jgi:TetR/AcrR family transcriptional repressor of nem operon
VDERSNHGGDRSISDFLPSLSSVSVTRPFDWVERQFQAMGREDARELAVALIAAYQGISLLTNTFRDPALTATEGRRLERWIDSLT